MLQKMKTIKEAAVSLERADVRLPERELTSLQNQIHDAVDTLVSLISEIREPNQPLR